MRALYYIFRSYLGSKINKYDFKHTDVYRGFSMYFSLPKEINGERKGLFHVLSDLNKLSRYYKCFPDTYFRFGMFMKTCNDFKIMKSFIPQYAYAKITASSNRHNILIDDKIIFHDLMTFYNLPVPNRFFIYRDFEFRQGSKTLSDVEVDNILSSVEEKRIYVKRYTGGAASGISILTKNYQGKWVNGDGFLINAKSIRELYNKDGYIFEQQVIQENDLAKYNPDTVNTIRVLTYNNKIISATVRFGGKGAFVDNTAKGGVAVSLDIVTGNLGEYGMREYDLNRYQEHPGTGIPFKNSHCSQWPKVIELVNKTLTYLPYYKSVGFDIATTNNGPIIIEINTGAGIYLSQMGKTIGIASSFGFN